MNGPWYLSWHDERGKRREFCSKTTDRATACRMLAKRVAEVAKRRDGIVSPAEAMLADAGLKPLGTHLDEYVADCRREGQADAFVASKAKALRALFDGGRAVRLRDLTPDLLIGHLAVLKGRGKSARLGNYVRGATIAFGNWCVRDKRLPDNPVLKVTKADESRVRRPFTDEKLIRLLAVAETRGRKEWYLAAALGGLRYGDLGRLAWADVDFEAGSLLVRDGKSGRDDLLPLHPALADALRALKAKRRPAPGDRVFPTIVDGPTRLRDFFIAGLADRVPVLNADGSTKMRPYGKGRAKREVPVTKLVAKTDGQGRVLDLHALRMTLSTQLARAGVAPQVAQKTMRHADYRTTLKHYTSLQLADTRSAIASIQLPLGASAYAAHPGAVHEGVWYRGKPAAAAARYGLCGPRACPSPAHDLCLHKL